MRIGAFRKVIATALVLCSFASMSSCLRARKVEVDSATLVDGRAFTTPVRVHLNDGGVIIFQKGARVTADSIVGTEGRAYSATMESLPDTRGARLADVLGVEVVTEGTNVGATVAYTVLTTPLAVVGVAALAVAIFGSCPTIYTDSAGTPVLEAESFSYSITPLLAKRDVDRLRAQPNDQGVVRLEIRNEALETHYIDQLQLLEVAHGATETVYPAAYGQPIAFANTARPYRATDRAGRDVTPFIAHADDAAFATADATLTSASDSDATDWIDIVLPRPAGDSLALALRMRSSLLTTMLFYDYMLHRPGAAAIDWLGHDMQRIATVAQFGRWSGANLALRIQVLRNGKYERVARLADFGPIAYRHVAVMIPAARDDSVRIRLDFTADQWRIDQVVVADGRRVAAKTIAPHRVVTGADEERADMANHLAKADQRHVMTTPGQRIFAEFMTTSSSQPRTYLLAAEGYYTEWIRGSWLKTPSDTVAFDPKRVRIGALLQEWHAARADMEARFFATKVPVI
jgi:hypothetical protein